MTVEELLERLQEALRRGEIQPWAEVRAGVEGDFRPRPVRYVEPAAPWSAGEVILR